MTDIWHVPIERLDRYITGDVDDPHAASIESHLLACADCRATLADRTRSDELVTSWLALERRVDAELRSPVERLAVRAGIADRHARLLAPTAALRLSWLLAMTAALFCAAVLARETSGVEATLSRLFFLTLAPLAPLAAVVTALGAGSEPAPEIARAAPASRLHVGALRAMTVMVASIAVGLGASAILPGGWIRAVVWLCPALALSAVGALVAGRVEPAMAISGLGIGWVTVVVTAARLSHDRLAAFHARPQLAYLVIAVIVAATITQRPALLELRSRR